MELHTFEELLQLPIAHTDTGDFLMASNGPQKEFLMRATIKKARAGLFFLQIEDRSFTTHKNAKFEVGQEVAAVVRPVIKDGKIEDFIVSGLEARE